MQTLSLELLLHTRVPVATELKDQKHLQDACLTIDGPLWIYNVVSKKALTVVLK